MLAPKAMGAGRYLGDASSRSSSSAARSLANSARFEIEPGGEPHIGVARPGVAIEAAVLAAAIGVDRPVESDVRRLVAGDDGLGLFPGDLGRERLGRLLARPAVVELLALLKLETARDVGRGAPPAPELGGHDAFGDRLGPWRGSAGGGADRGRVHGRVPDWNRTIGTTRSPPAFGASRPTSDFEGRASSGSPRRAPQGRGGRHPVG